jgi:glycosyltransferase involved in cell wall biosynthesis
MRISVLMPAYNAAAFIRRGIESLARQTLLPDEVIVSDDGSTDDTATIARALASENPRLGIKVIGGPNGGIAVARNRALTVASGDYISLLDADDEMLPEQLSRLAEGFARFSDAVLIFGDVTAKFADTGREVRKLVAGRMSGTTEDMGDGWGHFLNVFKMTLNGNRVPNQCTLIKRSALEACGAWDDAFRAVEDRDLFLRLSAQGAFYFYAEELAVKHERSESVSANLLLMSRYQFRAIAKAARYAPQAEVSRALRTSAAEFIYAASSKGLSEYLAARRELRNANVRVSAVESVKAWKRALIGAR